MATFRDWMEGDEMVRLTPDEDLQFGKILEQNVGGKSFKVHWKLRTDPDPVGIFENDYNPDDPNEKVLLMDRQHHEGEKVVHGGTGLVGEVIDSEVLATIFVPELRCVIQYVPMNLLTVTTLSTGERIYFKGWIGKVACVKHSVLVEYRDGTRGWMEMGQYIKTNASFGFETYQKSTLPFPGVLVKPTPKEFETMEWLGVGFMNSINHLFNSHMDEFCKVIRSQLKRVYVKWLCPLKEGAHLDEPKSELELDDLGEIVDFDMQFKDWMKTTSICQYVIRDVDKGVDENIVENRIIENILTQVEGPQEAKRCRPSPPSSKGYKPPVTGGDKHFVEVIRINHLYWVDWTQEEGACGDSGIGPPATHHIKLESGCELSPFTINLDACCHSRLEPFQIHHREYVLPKYILDGGEQIQNLIGVTQHRDLKNELYLVDFYGEVNNEEEGTAPADLFWGRHEVTKFDLYPHHEFGKLTPGAIVTLRGWEHDIEHNIGTVLRIDRLGMVEVHFGMYADSVSNHPLDVSPSDLTVISLPEEDNTNIHSSFGKCIGLSCELDEERVDFAESVANDLREFLDNEVNPNDIQIKQKLAGNISSFTVLMTGPRHTPYEHGLFEFDLQLPPTYPNVPPLIMLKSLPPRDAFLSYHFAKDRTVLHPRYKNWNPEDSSSKRQRWGWSRTVSLLDFLREIREDVFATEPILERAGLRFKDKSKIFRPATKLTMEAISKNAELVMTTVEMLIDLRDQCRKNKFWAAEIAEHFGIVKPLLESKFEYLLTTPCGVYADTSMIPKYQIFPISSGFRRSIARRIGILSLPFNSDASSDDEE